MNENNARNLADNHVEMRLSALDNPPAVASIKQRASGANDPNATPPRSLKALDVLALAMLDSCAGG